MKNTALVITICMIVLGIYDFYVVAFLGMDSTISRVMQVSGFASPWIPFCFGALAGHFWMYFPPKWKNSESLVKQMSERLIETDELGVRDGKFYWKGSGKCLDGQENS
jgi:hypothetical protein